MFDPSQLTLVCAATRFELNSLLDGREKSHSKHPEVFHIEAHLVAAVTGAGIPSTFAQLMPLVNGLHPDRIISIGIAGAYPDSGLQIGDLIVGDSECYGDVGFELPEEPGFQPITESPFGDEYRINFPLIDIPELNAMELRTGRGATVNCCTGTDATGRRRAHLTGAQFETMEGAVFAQFGQLAGIPVAELRAISNLAARRDMRPENIRLALQNLRGPMQLFRAACSKVR